MNSTPRSEFQPKDPDTYSVLVFLCLFSGLHRLYLRDFFGAGLRLLGDALGWILLLRGFICSVPWQIFSGAVLLAVLFVLSLYDARCAYTQVLRRNAKHRAQD